MLTVVNIKNGYRGPGYYIGRASSFGRVRVNGWKEIQNFSVLGNLFNMKNNSEEERNRVCDIYRNWLRSHLNGMLIDPLHIQAFDELVKAMLKEENFYLYCFCKPLRCHGDEIIFLINQFIKEMSEVGLTKEEILNQEGV